MEPAKEERGDAVVDLIPGEESGTGQAQQEGEEKRKIGANYTGASAFGRFWLHCSFSRLPAACLPWWCKCGIRRI